MASFLHRMSSFAQQTYKNTLNEEESNVADCLSTIVEKQTKDRNLLSEVSSSSKKQHHKQMRKRRCSVPAIMLHHINTSATCDENTEVNSLESSCVNANITLPLEQMLLQGKTQHLRGHNQTTSGKYSEKKKRRLYLSSNGMYIEAELIR
ncbi:unnamed protein product [Didymodactylos carnosus]|uniref:Uncharacterized protein n=1 Tax=Didymodactylos carnosus TaxID=1234261 RepID=A0A8S2GNY4_9BILA|nr:unnamed protein product [Didymodactylos carnosus]CAF3543313.1 unnamed protein product [Didymodactylos carnosus]